MPWAIKGTAGISWVLNLRLRPSKLSFVEAKDAKLSFEDALSRLEAVVGSMESGEVPLAELLSKFEEGNKLLKLCEARLKEAELKIEQLKKQREGVSFEPFEGQKDA